MHKQAIFPIFYLPPLDFFAEAMRRPGGTVLEKHEHFPKQTYRNRAVIHSPNGKLNLVVPVVKGSKVHTPVKDVRISYDFNWQRLHWQSLQTSYRSSAYFEFYEDEFAPFYQTRTVFLVDFNLGLLQKLVSLLKLDISYCYTKGYEKEYPAMDDYRQRIHPKQGALFEVKPYFQLFEQRNGFIPNLSIVDLLFNQGPQSRQFLIQHG